MNSGLQLYPQHIVRKRAELIKQICDIEKLLFECVPEQQPYVIEADDKLLMTEDIYGKYQMTVYKYVFYDKILNRFFYMDNYHKIKSPKKHSIDQVRIWALYEGVKLIKRERV